MNTRRWSIPVAGLVVALAAWWTLTGHTPRAEPARPTVALQQAPPALNASASAPVSEDAIRALDIAFFERRVAEDSSSATDRSMLAALYMERARATGGFSDYERAERLARRSLAIRTEHNGQTFGILAGALLARHAFPEALAVARRADSLDPGVAGHLALLGEIELETGDYAAANAHFSAIHFDGEQFTIAARLARWRELTGRTDAARRLLQGAVSRVDRRDDLPREQVAWFHYRLAELELRAGQLDAADSAFRRGLAIFPGDYRILGGLARLAAARGQWQQSIDYGNEAIAIQLDPAAMGTISDAYAALGDTAQAEQYARAMTASALKQPGPIHRAWGLFLLDHGTPADVKRVLAKTRVEMHTRHDVYGDDLLAWGLYKQGHYSEARAASMRALGEHTEDAQLYYHAGMIERALGDTGTARAHLEQAMRMNAHFSPTQSIVARSVLDSLGGPTARIRA